MRVLTKQAVKPRVLAYPARFEWSEKDGEYLVSFRDLKGVNTSGADIEEAIDQAQDALALMIASLIEHGREIGKPSRKEADEVLVPVPEEEALKLLIHEAMKVLELSKRAAALRVGMDPSQFGKVIKPRQSTKISTLRSILASLGMRTGIVAYSAPEEKRAV